MVYLILGLWVLTILFSIMQSQRQSGHEIGRLERKIDALLKKLDVNPDADVDAEVLTLIRADRKIEAIKRYRQATGVGLKDAKDYVERL